MPVPLSRMWGVKEKRYGQMDGALNRSAENLFQNAKSRDGRALCTVRAGANDGFTAFGYANDIFNIFFGFIL